jgi:ubiquinone/menaquinone biosynthesis C-methylase UbiE
MTTSADISRAFYDRLGAEGLMARSTSTWDQQIIAQVLPMLQPGQRVLDVGCGYGRLAIPLAAAGAHVVGLDISRRLLEAAHQQASSQGVPVAWLQASMCQIPCLTNTFEVALCLWSAFYELLSPTEQLAAIRDITRVLQPGGWALIEGPPYVPATLDDVRAGRRYGPEGRLTADVIEEFPNPHYRHDATTFAHLMQAAGLCKYRVYIAPWAGRPRQFLWFAKSVSMRGTT